MSKQSLDILKRIELQLNQPDKTLIDVLSWLEQSELIKDGTLDSIRPILSHLHEFEWRDPDEFIGMLRVYLLIFERFPLEVRLREEYFLVWQAFLDTYTAYLTPTSIQDARYIIVHQVKFLQLYSDGFDKIRVLANGLAYRVQSMYDSLYSGSAAEHEINLESLNAFYLSRLSDQEALDVTSQLILSSTR